MIECLVIGVGLLLACKIREFFRTKKPEDYTPYEREQIIMEMQLAQWRREERGEK